MGKLAWLEGVDARSGICHNNGVLIGIAVLGVRIKMANTSLTWHELDNAFVWVIDTVTGDAFVTQAGYARMSGLSQQAISKRMQGHDQDQFKLAEVQTTKGSQAYILIPANIVFKWLMKDNPSTAKKMGEAGATVCLHHAAGRKIESKPLAFQ